MDGLFPREGNFTDSASTGAKFGSPSVALQNDVVTALLRVDTHTHTHFAGPYEKLVGGAVVLF